MNIYFQFIMDILKSIGTLYLFYSIHKLFCKYTEDICNIDVKLNYIIRHIIKMKYDKVNNKSIDQEYEEQSSSISEIGSPEESFIDSKLIQELKGTLSNLRNDLEKIIDEEVEKEVKE